MFLFFTFTCLRLCCLPSLLFVRVTCIYICVFFLFVFTLLVLFLIFVCEFTVLLFADLFSFRLFVTWCCFFLTFASVCVRFVYWWVFCRLCLLCCVCFSFCDWVHSSLWISFCLFLFVCLLASFSSRSFAFVFIVFFCVHTRTVRWRQRAVWSRRGGHMICTDHDQICDLRSYFIFHIDGEFTWLVIVL